MDIPAEHVTADRLSSLPLDKKKQIFAKVLETWHEFYRVPTTSLTVDDLISMHEEALQRVDELGYISD
jgi:hypothetical protein